MLAIAVRLVRTSVLLYLHTGGASGAETRVTDWCLSRRFVRHTRSHVQLKSKSIAHERTNERTNRRWFFYSFGRHKSQRSWTSVSDLCHTQSACRKTGTPRPSVTAARVGNTDLPTVTQPLQKCSYPTGDTCHVTKCNCKETHFAINCNNLNKRTNSDSTGSWLADWYNWEGTCGKVEFHSAVKMDAVRNDFVELTFLSLKRAPCISVYFTLFKREVELNLYSLSVIFRVNTPPKIVCT
jgi:hypothetical protein